MKKKNHAKQEIEIVETPKKALIIALCILVVFGFMYFLTTKILAKEKETTKKDNKETTIQYDKILAGESFGKDQEEYYVIYYDSTEEEDNLKSLISTYQSKTDVIRLYSVDLNDGMNKKYITDGEIVTSSPSELQVKNPTLLHFKSKGVIEVIDQKGEIKEFLSK